MGYEVFIIGENIDTSEYHTDSFVLKDNKCLVSFNTKEEAVYAVNKINNVGINKAFLYEEIKKVLEQPIQEYTDLEHVSYKDMINNQFNKDEQFVIVNDGFLSLWSVQNCEVENILRDPFYGSFVLSNTGIFLINFYTNKLKCFTKDFVVLFFDFYFESVINKIEFSRNDKYVLVFTKYKVHIIDVYKGDIILSIVDNLQVLFDYNEDIVHLLDTKRSYNLITGCYDELPKDLNFVKFSHNQSFYFYKGKSQMINYNKNNSISKTQANIENIKFGFTNNSGYAYITKKIKDVFLYSLEVYINNKIYSIGFEDKPVDFCVSESIIVVYTETRNILIYKRKDKNYYKYKEINKEGGVLLSLSNTVCCIFDETSENLEFYDNGELRSVYLHRGCTGLHWSESGLYLVSLSSISGVFQLFNNNGVLVFKKVFNVFTDFKWRPFIKLSEDLKDNIKNYDISKYTKELDVINKEEYNIDSLISDWKSFLMTKKRLLIN